LEKKVMKYLTLASKKGKVLERTEEQSSSGYEASCQMLPPRSERPRVRKLIVCIAVQIGFPLYVFIKVSPRNKLFWSGSASVLCKCHKLQEI
jgi:hypothetical protein